MKSIKTKAKTIFVMLLAFTLVFTAGCAKGTANEKDIVAKVGDEVISKDAYNKVLSMHKKIIESQRGDQIWTEDYNGKTYLQVIQEEVLDKMITEEAVIQYMEKEKVKIDEKEIDEQYKAFMEGMKGQEEAEKILKELKEIGIDESFWKKQMKSDIYVSKFQEKTIKELDLTDEKLKAYYEKNKDQYTKDQAKASHILVETEKEAKDILAKIKAGEDFAELAKKYSKDPGSAAMGGSLGIFPKGMMVPEFEKVAFSLKDGEVSDIVKTQFGYHIIKGDSIKFEDVRGEIEGEMMQSGVMDKINKVKESLKIEKFLENIK